MVISRHLKSLCHRVALVRDAFEMKLKGRAVRMAHRWVVSDDAPPEVLGLKLTAALELSRLQTEPARAMICGVVFSMDRALQLHALLGSYQDLVTGCVKLTVIYRVSNECHDAAYREVLEEYAGLVEVKRQETRQDFKALLIDALSESVSEHVFFLVDDNMFVEPVDLQFFSSKASTYCVPSLRMGQNLSFSYTLQRQQAIPHHCAIESEDSQLLAWLWKDGELDWNYPLSVDGHMFQRAEMLALAKSLDFDSPNILEEQLQRFNTAFSWRIGLCYEKSRLINITYNKVQTDNENLHGSVHQKDMLRMWNEGYQIDRKSYYGIVNESAHQELPLHLTRKTATLNDKIQKLNG